MFWLTCWIFFSCLPEQVLIHLKGIFCVLKIFISIYREVVWWHSSKKCLQWNDFLMCCIDWKFCWWTRLSSHYIIYIYIYTNWLVENSMANFYSLILLSLTAWSGAMFKWGRLFSPLKLSQSWSHGSGISDKAWRATYWNWQVVELALGWAFPWYI